MPEKMVMVGLLPEVVVIDPGDQVSWLSNAGNLKIEFDSRSAARFPPMCFRRLPASVFRAAPRAPASTPGSYKLSPARSTTWSSATAKSFSAGK